MDTISLRRSLTDRGRGPQTHSQLSVSIRARVKPPVLFNTFSKPYFKELIYLKLKLCSNNLTFTARLYVLNMLSFVSFGMVLFLENFGERDA